VPKVRNRSNGQFLTPRQIEAEYGLPYSRIYGWLVSGQLKRLANVGRALYVRRADLEAFLASNTQAVRS